MPRVVELFAFAVRRELGGQDGLDMLWLARHNEARAAEEGDFDHVGLRRSAEPAKEIGVKFVQTIIHLVPARGDEEGYC
jgi:hypothetical protein